MVYKPSLSDLEESGGKYNPSIHDISDNPASQQLVESAKRNAINQEQGRTISPHEEFSNPTQYPGFENLSHKEKLARIALSQFDPSNRNQVGGMVPPGAYEQPASRVGAEFLSNALLPGAKTASPLINAISRVAGGTALNTGLAQINPENTNSLIKNAGHQALINSLVEGVPFGLGKLAQAGKSLTYPWRPSSKSEEILHHLGSGSQNAEQNAQSFSNEVMNAHKKHYDTYASKVNPVLDKYGNKDLYLTKNDKGVSTYNPQIELKLETNSKRLNNKVKEFNKDPTFRNAHELQSEIGSEMGEVGRWAPSMEKKDIMHNLKEGRDSVKKSQDAFLANVDPASRKAYKESSNYFKENIIPYRSDKILRNIIEGKETNPKNLHGIFEYPTDLVDKKSMERYIGPINKVASDLSPQTINRIIYSKVGGHKSNLTNESLLKSLKESKQSGYSKYYNPELENHIQDLSSRIERGHALGKSAESAKKVLGAALGGAAGAYGGHVMGNPAYALAGAVAGAPIVPMITNALLSLKPSVKESTKNALKKILNTSAKTLGSEENAINERIK